MLGQRVIPLLRQAFKGNLLQPDARVIPERGVLYGRLLQYRLCSASGFDISAMNVYRWHPTAEAVDPDGEQRVEMSRPFHIGSVDFYTAAHSEPASLQETNVELSVETTAAGVWNALEMWHSLSMTGDGEASRPSEHAVYYLDEIEVCRGDIVHLSVARDDTQFVVTSKPAQWRPRHACVPTWHYDMLNDETRNGAYDRSIGRAIAAMKKHGEVRFCSNSTAERETYNRL